MKKILLTMTMAAMALTMGFASNAEAGRRAKGAEPGRKFKVVERTQRIDRHTVIVFHEMKVRGRWVKHGPYEELFNGRVVLAGQFDHGRRDGRWVRWSTDGRYRKIKIITYENGRKLSVYRPVYKTKKVVMCAPKPDRRIVRIQRPHLHVSIGF